MSDWASGGSWEYTAPAPVNVVAKPGVRQLGSFGVEARRAARGFIAGRFAPPHRGHQYAIDFARGCVENLTIIVVATPNDPLPAAARVAWLKAQYPKVGVITVEVGSAPGSQTFVDQFIAVTRARVGAVDCIFGSELPYQGIAPAFGARYVPVDPARAAVPISGTAMRANIVESYRHLIPSAREYFIRRVAIIGAPHSGKTALATRLAAEFRATLVPAWQGPAVLERASQAALEDALAADSLGRDGGVMICDGATDRPYDLYLACTPPPIVAMAAPVIELYGSPDERARLASDAIVSLFSPATLLSASGTRAASALGWL